MKAIRFHRLGGPETLVLEDVPEPEVGPSELLIKVHAAGVNFADTRFTLGAYFQRPVFPQIPGMEAAGEVVGVGDGVNGFHVGDRVMSALVLGAYAQYARCKAVATYAMPKDLSYVEAAALPVQGLTAHHVLFLVGQLREGQTVLVQAAAGGVGTLAVQLAKRIGARVIATASSDEKLRVAKSLGADVGINTTSEDVLRQTMAATAGKGADLVLEMTGGAESFKRTLGCLAPMGKMVVFGAASGDTRGTLEPVGLMHKNLTVSGYYMTPLLSQRSLCDGPMQELGKYVADKQIRVLVGSKYGLADSAQAHRDITSRKSIGKLIVQPWDSLLRVGEDYYLTEIPVQKLRVCGLFLHCWALKNGEKGCYRRWARAVQVRGYCVARSADIA